MIQIPDHIRGLVFDCDGTIVNNMPLHYKAWHAALAEHGYDYPEATFYEFAGVPTARIIEILNQRHGYKLPVEKTAIRKEEIFERLIPESQPIEPVVSLIHQYAGKLPMAVATGGTRDICTKTLSALKLVEFFQFIVTADDVRHGKPAPDIFLEAARLLNVPPADCCAFEDAEMGLRAARSAGMLVFDIRPWVTVGGAPAPSSAVHGATSPAGSPAAIKPIAPAAGKVIAPAAGKPIAPAAGNPISPSANVAQRSREQGLAS